jgi:tRNA dimethylallyltransferase
MKQPILIISGPTASGKTGLAIKLMKLLNGELISADSRQIYKGFDIGTGKDHPKNIKINMIDILDPSEQYSVTQYRQTVLPLIKKIQLKGKLPIIVGGTGQYIQSLIEAPRETFHIKPNKFLRFFLNRLSVKYLQRIYKFLDKEKYFKLNNSDIHNPHRLIRKIEIKIYPVSSRPRPCSGINPDRIKNYLHISLTAPNSYLFKNIDQRVDERIEMGLEQEIQNLRKLYKWSSPAFRTHAYKEFEVGFNQKSIQRWHYDEHRYVHRQKTWFKKMPKVNFFDITSSSYPQNAINFALKCYNKV